MTNASVVEEAEVGFDYSAAAELFPTRNWKSRRQGYRRFAHAADAIRFAIEELPSDALKRIEPDMLPGEAGLLSAFDSNRKLIYATAAEVYERRHKGSYDLVAADF